MRVDPCTFRLIKNITQIEVDALNPSAAVQQALDAARNSEEIAKYLGTTESKQRAGITGDVELVSFDSGKLVLRLTGNFWHNRQVCMFVLSYILCDRGCECVSEIVVYQQPSKENRERFYECELQLCYIILQTLLFLQRVCFCNVRANL